MASTNQISTRWLGDMAFESTNPSGLTFRIDASPEDGGAGAGLRPKALMLSSLAGCSGLDVAALMRKMKVEVRDFRIDITAGLSEEHPKTYTDVTLEYHFYGPALDHKKLERAVQLSVEKYCGVIEMFRSFSRLEWATFFHDE